MAALTCLQPFPLSLVGNSDGTSFSKTLCLMFVCILCKFVSGIILCSFCVDNLWLDDLCAEQIGDRLNFVFNPMWLTGLKILTN